MRYIKIENAKFKHYLAIKTKLEESFDTHSVVAMIAEEEVVGLILYAAERIVAVTIKDEYRRMGYGTDVLNYHMHHLGQGEQTITVAMHDSDTLAFLFKIGFRNEGFSTVLYDKRGSVKRLILKRSAEQTFETDTVLEAVEVELNTLLENILIP